MLDLVENELKKLEDSNELVVIENGKAELAPLLARKLALTEQEIKEAQNFQKEYKAKILKAMEDNGILKIENEEIRINYIAPTIRETLDSKKLKEEHPEVYEEYLKVSDVASSIKIKCK